MQIAFRKNADDVVSWAIRKWTSSKYSHCEIEFTNGLTFSADPECFCTRFKTVVHDDSEWDFIEIPITREAEYRIYDWCLNEEGCWYDIIGITFTQIIPLSFQSKWWWFCSELCTAALQLENIVPEIVSWQTDPGELYKKLKEFYERKN